MKSNRRNPFVSHGVLLLAFLVFFVVLPAALADDETAKPPKPATFDYQEAIDDLRIDELHMHLAWLADEAQEGRSAGTEAGHRTADYLVTQLTLLGLESAGPDDSFVQGFRFSGGQPRYRNVAGVIRGSDPELSDEYVMICAHFDHVGVMYGEVYPGANDNASGTSMVLELAESLQKIAPRPKRSVIVAFWDAEEKGLLGSLHFADNPTVPLSQIKIVFNFDMVGTLQNNTFEIFGSNTATGTREIVSRLILPDDPDIDFSTEYLLGSDHSSFYAKRIPALMFFTGLDCPYHTPDDNLAQIHFEGMKQIADIAFRVIYHLADSDDLAKIQYLAPRDVRRDTEKAWDSCVFWVTDTMGLTFEDDGEPAGDGVHSLGRLLGSLFAGTDSDEKNGEQGGGLRIAKVADGSCAAKIGLKRGDRIMTFNGRNVEDRYTFDSDLVACLEEEPDCVMYLRAARPRESNEWLRFEIHPDDLEAVQIVRQGFLSWESQAEPGVLIVGDVFSEPAVSSGLQPDDRVMHVNGTRASSETLREAVKAKRPLTFEIERYGKIFHLELSL
ncbi:MAG: M28 family peptidase [Planctomycetaceae bacterium]|nr:M28 family peptidase [Planctomycetaceae bacterium]